MSARLVFVSGLLMLVWPLHGTRTVHAPEDTVALDVFVRAGGPHCDAANTFLRPILTSRQLTTPQYYWDPGLSTVASLFDAGLLVPLALITPGRHRWEEQAGRWLNLLSGAVMIRLGVLLILKPDLTTG